MHSRSDAVHLAASEPGGALYNPLAAAAWSVLFTPAFGAYLVMRNWQALGLPRQAVHARRWFRASLALLALQALSAAFNARVNSQPNLVYWLGLAWLLLWFVAAALPQALAVRARYGAAWPRRQWDGALLAAVLAGTTYWLSSAAFTALFVAVT